MSIVSLAQAGFKQATIFAVKEAPTILTGIAAAGTISAIVMGVDGGMKAARILDAERNQRLTDWSVETGEDESAYPEDRILPIKEEIELTWKCYIPAIVMGGVSLACMISANSISLQRNAALASLYALTDTALKEYQEQVALQLGDKKVEKLRDSISKKQLEDHPLSGCEVILTGAGETLFFEPLSSRYFKSNMEKVRRAQNDFNYELLTDNYKTLNEWYDALDMSHTLNGRYMGWTNDSGLLDIHFSAQMTEDGSTSCIVLNYKILPHKE